MLLHVSLACYFVLLSNIPLSECSPIYLSILLVTEISIVSILTITNTAALNIHVQISLWTYVFFFLGKYLRVELLG